MRIKIIDGLCHVLNAGKTVKVFNTRDSGEYYIRYGIDLENNPVPVRDDPVEVRNDPVEVRNDPVEVRNDPEIVRSDPVVNVVRSDPVEIDYGGFE
jgi:hypothetical protein